MSDYLVEECARAIYELDPFEEGGEYVDGFQVSPGGKLSWEQARDRDAEFADDKIMLPVTKFAMDAARAAIACVQRHFDLPPTKSEMDLRRDLEQARAEVVHTQDELGALLHAAEAKLAEVQRWRPIETAPKDDSIDIWVKSPRSGATMRIPNAYWDEEIEDWRCGSSGRRLKEIGYQATHWMPLPSPPE